MPTNHDNPPNQAALTYRLATHPTALQHMLARLHAQQIPPNKHPLASLTTHATTDPAIALLDAWAVVVDVLTFYQERIANESFLRTATERRSLLELARTVGYKPKPGLAATVSVAFTVETEPGMPDVISLSVGLKIQSLPEENQLPQLFETVETIEARPEWNSLKPFIASEIIPQTLTRQTRTFKLAGIRTGLIPGDLLLIVADQGNIWSIATVQTVTVNPTAGYTEVTSLEPLETVSGTFSIPQPNVPATMPGEISLPLERGALSLSQETLVTPQLFTFRQHSRLFGYAAPAWQNVPAEFKQMYGGLFVLRTTESGWQQIRQGLPSQTETRAVLAYRQRWVDYLFVGTEGSGVFRSTDGGATWTECNANLSNKSIFSLYTDGREWLYAGASDGTIFRSIDHGDNWTQFSGSSLITQIVHSDNSKPDEYKLVDKGLPKMCIQAICTYTYKSKREGRAISEDYFLVGTDNGLYRSTDGGASWVPFSKNGPVFEGVRALLADDDNPENPVAFIGTDEGLFSISYGRLQSPRPKELQTYGADPTQEIELWDVIVSTQLVNRAVYALAKDIKGGLLVGTDDGIFLAQDRQQLQQTTWTRLPDIEPLPNRIFDLAVTVSGQILVAKPLGGFVHSDWPGFVLDATKKQLDLEAVYQNMLGDKWLVLSNGELMRPYKLASVSTVYREEFNQAAKVSQLQLELGEGLEQFGGPHFRDIRVYGQSEALPLYEEVRQQAGTVEGATIRLDRATPPLEPGRRVIITGKPFGEDQWLSEVCRVQGTDLVEGFTYLTLEEPLKGCYEATTVSIQANVALATHGQTVADEVLGSGAGTETHQKFQLRQPPLTYLPGPTETGAESTLTVRVNGVEWRETATLYERGPNDPCYLVRHNEQNQTFLIFGDGKRGARLPTGTENIVATYRRGLGLEGEVEAHSLTNLQTRPLGVVEVTNPLPAAGGASPETLEQVRQNAPGSVQTLGRIVSLADYEHFVRAYAGIGKAQTAVVWANHYKLIHITVADTDGDSIDESSALFQNLLKAMDQRRNCLEPLRLQSYERLLFNLEARILFDARYRAADVQQRVAAALIEAFTFQKRAFGQAVSSTEVLLAMEDLPGVIAVDLDYLYLAGTAKASHSLLQAHRARWQNGQLHPAQLLLLNPDSKHGLRLKMEGQA